MSEKQQTGTTEGEPQLLADLRDGALWLTFNRPDAGNAITADLREDLLARLRDAAVDPLVRCIVLAANGRHFCTGADLRAQKPVRPAVEDRPERLVGDIRRIMHRGSQAIIHAILDCEKPVVAKVQGAAAGLGAHIVFACDLSIASENATFTEIFARRGIADDALGTWLLPRLVGLTRARELVLLAETVPAARAAEIGLITRVAAAEDFDASVEAIVGTLAAGPTAAYAVDKWLLNRSLDEDRHTIAQEEAVAVEMLSHSLDAKEGVLSFIERRPTEFVGY